MLILFTRFSKHYHMRRIGALAREVAERSQGDVWGRVQQLIFDMHLHEARGYIRARSKKVVRRQVEMLRHQHQLDPQAQSLLMTMATERVVQLVMADFVGRRSAARRAAA